MSILVGYDGSPGAAQALTWGVEEALLRGLPLTVCHAWAWPYASRPPDGRILEQVKSVGAAVVESGARRAREMAADLDVRPVLAEGAPSAAILAAAADAELVVLGSRGHGGFENLHIGSTAIQVPAHSPRPVVVVRPTLPPVRSDGVRIVVGVDGSPAGETALAFAFAAAELRGGSVVAVCGWWDPGAVPGPDRLPFADPAAVWQAAETRFEQSVAPWPERHPEVPATMEFVDERPQRALVKMAKDAVLLVVGCRGIGSVPGMLLGPVTQAVLATAPCPVAVTPPSK